MEPDIIIDKVYLITTNLFKSVSYKYGFISHSALLLKTKSGDYFKLDSQNEQRQYILLPNLKQVHGITNVGRKVKIGKSTWDVHETCKMVNEMTIFAAYNFMIALSLLRPYSLLNWNCHILQEETRRFLGLNVRENFSVKGVLMRKRYVIR